eukprot:TRINITY_DN114416_c0_g1_i1.p1 TRINITY_DN114416_c0_g1~~TRINITY_DN114416_c0_g1_i1.p1  ORF type:complete len:197 (+),score=26.14 TRINITY_DN114416_c0_g1_i1:49-639(+)
MDPQRRSWHMCLLVLVAVYFLRCGSPEASFLQAAAPRRTKLHDRFAGRRAGLLGALLSCTRAPAAAEQSRPLRLSQALKTEKPIVVRFSASWCPGCRELDRTMGKLEQSYGSEVAFVTVDCGDFPPSKGCQVWSELFGVEALPHVAFVDSDGHVPTALIGKISSDVLAGNVEALRKGRDLPYLMYDAFGEKGLQRG